MRHPSPRLTLPFLVLALSACAEAEPSVDHAAEEQAIRAIDAGWNQAMADGDVDAVVALYAEDGYLAPAGSPPISGEAGLREAWTGMLGLPGLEIAIEPGTIDVAEAGDMAVESGAYVMAFDGEDGRVEDEGKYVVAWKKVDGQWKVAADIFNSNLAGQ